MNRLLLKNDGLSHVYTVGRSADITVGQDNQFCSRQHLRLEVDKHAIIVVDTSSNGTVVDGKHLKKGMSAAVKDGSVLDLCGTPLAIEAYGW